MMQAFWHHLDPVGWAIVALCVMMIGIVLILPRKPKHRHTGQEQRVTGKATVVDGHARVVEQGPLRLPERVER